MLFGFVEGDSVDLFAFWFSYVWAASSFVSLVVTSWVSLFVLGLFGFVAFDSSGFFLWSTRQWYL